MPFGNGDFVDAELLTPSVSESIAFYRRVFDWDFRSWLQNELVEYWTVNSAGRRSPGIYYSKNAPKPLVSQNLWMPCIAVNDMEQTIQDAEKLGGSLLYGPHQDTVYWDCAIVSDPTGGAFTLFDGMYNRGRELSLRADFGLPGHLAWNLIFTSEASGVREFYLKLFGWIAVAKYGQNEGFSLCSSKGRHIADIVPTDPDKLKSTSFWGNCFSVSDLDKVEANIIENGGNVLEYLTVQERQSILATDPFGGKFVVTRNYVFR